MEKNNPGQRMSEKLTPRELEILRRLSGPLNQREIAQKLNLALSTTKWYVQQIYQKLGVNARSEAVRYAKTLGILSGETLISDPRVDPQYQLPAQITNFIGRQNEMTIIKDLIVRSRLVTLTGVGGVGKTRLALQTAEHLQQRSHFAGLPFSDIRFIDLTPLSEPIQISQAVIDCLNLQVDPVGLVTEKPSAFVCKRSALLVLDNCEHLVDTCASLVKTLLHACSNLQFLITSRQPLRLAGEAIYSVPPMAYPVLENHLDLDQSTAYEAIQLFTARAEDAQPGFKINSQNINAVASICQQLDGIPLAIELAAVRLRLLSVEQIAELLADRFKLLVDKGRRTLPRHRTLEELIAWSYNLLSGQEMLVFQRLSVFSGGWNLDAMLAVCADEQIRADEILDLLEKLVDKSLVTKVDLDGEARYQMLETVRHYARLKLVESGEHNISRRRHAEWLVGLVENAEPALRSDRQMIWLRKLDREAGNLRSILVWSLENEEIETVLRLVGALHYYWIIRGRIQEGRRYLEGAVALARHHVRFVPDQWKAKALLGQGWMALEQRELIAARKCVEEALRIYREIDDQFGIGLALYLLSAVFFYQRDSTVIQKAHSTIQESLLSMKAMKDSWGIGICLDQLAHVLDAQGDFDAGYEVAEQSIGFLEYAGDRRSLIQVLIVLAWHSWNRGKVTKAGQYFDTALKAARELGDRLGEANILIGCGIKACWTGDYSEAKSRLEESLLIYQDFGDAHNEAVLIYQLGELHRWGGELDKALYYFEESRKIFQVREEEAWTGWMLCHLGYTNYLCGDIKLARRQLLDSLEVLERLQEDVGQHQFGLFGRYIYRYLGEFCLGQEELDQANRWFCQGLELVQSARCMPHVPEYLESFAKLAEKQKLYIQSAMLFGSAEKIRQRFGIVIPPVDQPARMLSLSIVQDSLSETFENFLKQGQNFNLEQAIEAATNIER